MSYPLLLSSILVLSLPALQAQCVVMSEEVKGRYVPPVHLSMSYCFSITLCGVKYLLACVFPLVSDRATESELLLQQGADENAKVKLASMEVSITYTS